AELAQKLFLYPDVKTLLLSATPYKMLTLDYEDEDDHYPDFLKTLDFLFNSKIELEAIKQEIQNFRQSLYSQGSVSSDSCCRARDALQARLSKVMCRTERVGSTKDQDAMLSECRDKLALESRDLHDAVLADRVASSVGARDIIEYWKASPYLINFLRRYEFRKKLEAQCEEPSEALISALSSNASRLLKKADMMKYRKLVPSNPRMRDLFSLTIDQGLWKILWMPPSMPYSKPEGAYAEVKNATKYLVFSAWNVVPDAIASLCSFEAERRMLAGYHKKIRHDELYDDLHPLLRYARSPDGRLTGMPVVGMLYPGPSLASLVDPLQIAMDYQGEGLISTEELLKKAESILEPHVRPLLAGAVESAQEDQRWYWAAPARMAAWHFPGLKDWMLNYEQGWYSVSADGEDDKGEIFKEHLRRFTKAMDRNLDPPLGRPPDDLLRILSLIAVAGPGTCALRSLRRQCPNLAWDAQALLKGTVMISEGFRTLFNLPETMALLRDGDTDKVYWQLVLEHNLKGNIQSLLDEQAHCLCESLGVIDESEDKRAEAIGESIGSALSIRTSPLQLDEVRVSAESRKVELESYRTRCRFALRFAELKDEKGSTLARADTVRDAFNSPFRPFILASTSIGQEGLDFHTWCHAVIHWNLPTNPVDLEQREGRVHRYKGHAIRKNIAMNYGLESLKSNNLLKADPWKWMFEQANLEKLPEKNDLWPYWLYELEGGAKIERHIPILDYSREALLFHRLKKMLAAYRLVFGQPRQEDLLAYLMDRQEDTSSGPDPDAWRICLEPPE
ncbi:MAG: helicase-related protein, partial [Acidobacteriota bacterium]